MDSTLAPDDSKAFSSWSPYTIGLLTLLFGVSNGLFLAAINWFRLRKYLKGTLHLIAGALILLVPFLSNLFDIPFEMFAYWQITAEGLARFALSFGLTLAVIYYLDRLTQYDIQQLEQAEVVVKKTHWATALFTILVLGLVSGFVTNSISQVLLARDREYTRQLVFCEILQPGSTRNEVQSALSDEFGTLWQFDDDVPRHAPEEVSSFFDVRFEDPDIDATYQLYLRLGYDVDEKLVWVARPNWPWLEEVVCEQS